MSIEEKIPNLKNQDRIASALENLAGTVVSDTIKAYVDEQIKAKRLESRPVGYVWVSFDSTNPGTIVGGTWELVEQGRMLLSAGSNYSVGSTGGEAEHTLTQSELPKITGDIWNVAVQDSGISILGTSGVFSPLKRNEGHGAGTTVSNNGYDGFSMSFGDNKPHNNMSPYIAVYMFRRTA